MRCFGIEYLSGEQGGEKGSDWREKRGIYLVKKKGMRRSRVPVGSHEWIKIGILGELAKVLSP